MYQGLNFILALAALWLVALGVYLRYNAGVWEGVSRLRQRNGDAKRDGFLRFTYCWGRRRGEGITMLQVNVHTERDRKGSIVSLLC